LKKKENAFEGFEKCSLSTSKNCFYCIMYRIDPLKFRNAPILQKQFGVFVFCVIIVPVCGFWWRNCISNRFYTKII